MFVEARITHVKDLSQYKIGNFMINFLKIIVFLVFNDGDERIVKRNQMLLKGEKHYDNVPLPMSESMKSTCVLFKHCQS